MAKAESKALKAQRKAVRAELARGRYTLDGARKIAAMTAIPASAKPPWKIPEAPPGVGPKDARMAMDDMGSPNSALMWAANQVGGSMVGPGAIGFMGYPYLAELAQRPEYRKISEVIATEATRKWVKIGTNDSERSNVRAKRDKIAAIKAEFERLRVRDAFAMASEIDGWFGRAHFYFDLGNNSASPQDEAELKTPIGDGSGKLTKGKISPDNPLQRISVIEPTWTYPSRYNTSNPLDPHWYRPEQWYVLQKEVHASRLLPFVTRPLPDILKPAYMFGGLSLSQIAKPYVDNWLRTRQSVADIVNAFSVFALSTDMSMRLEKGGEEALVARAETFNTLRNNRGVFMMDRDTETFTNVAAPLGTLDALQSQSQEQQCSVVSIPVVKLLGIQPSGMNASSQGELESFYTSMGSYQTRNYTDPLNRVLRFMQLSLFGEVDPDIVVTFEPLWSLTAKEIAELQNTKATRDRTFADAGVISPEEVRARLAADPESDYDSIDPDDLPDLLGEEEAGLPVRGRLDQQAASGEGAEGAPTETEADGDKLGEIGDFGKIGGAKDAAVVEWQESKHKRGQPENAGQFGPGGGGAKPPAKTGAAKKSEQAASGQRQRPPAATGAEPQQAGQGSRAMVDAPADRNAWPDHVKALKLPPAWTDVRFAADPNDALQAIGHDAKGRKQYVYSAEFSQAQSAAKFARISELIPKFAAIEKQNAANRRSGDKGEVAHADATALIMAMGVRPGSDKDTQSKVKAYGATTLEGRHVLIDGDQVRLQFTGKKGVNLNLPVDDPDVAKMLRSRKQSAGDDGKLFGDVSDSSLRDYVHKLDGGGFKTKDFRTYVGTSTAQRMVEAQQAPADVKGYKKTVMQVAKAVSAKLGNTPAMALSAYIDPRVFAPWRQNVAA